MSCWTVSTFAVASESGSPSSRTPDLGETEPHVPCYPWLLIGLAKGVVQREALRSLLVTPPALDLDAAKVWRSSQDGIVMLVSLAYGYGIAVMVEAQVDHIRRHNPFHHVGLPPGRPSVKQVGQRGHCTLRAHLQQSLVENVHHKLLGTCTVAVAVVAAASHVLADS